jgi:hypothetical protein
MKKQIKMITNCSGHDEAEDGRNLPLKDYLKGEMYLVCESLYNCFKAMGVCEDAEPVKETKAPAENKDLAKAKGKK